MECRPIEKIEYDKKLAIQHIKSYTRSMLKTEGNIGKPEKFSEFLIEKYAEGKKIEHELDRGIRTIYDSKMVKLPYILATFATHRKSISFRGIKLYSRAHISELRIGSTVLPLKVKCDITDKDFAEIFGIPKEQAINEYTIQREAIRNYFRLEEKAAQGILTVQEMNLWKKMCEIVDRKKSILMRESNKPRRSIGEVITQPDGSRTVKWVSGHILPISTKALKAIEFLNIGEWFEADIIQDSNSSIIKLFNIDLREDYCLATDDEIKSFFCPKIAHEEG